MIYPAINDLTKKVGSRYSLVVATAKRARELVNGSEALVDVDSNKPVKIAVNEIFRGKVLLTQASKRAFPANIRAEMLATELLESSASIAMYGDKGGDGDENA